MSLTINSQKLTRIILYYILVQFKLQSYTNQSVNAVYGNNCCLFWDPHKIHKYTVRAEKRIF